MNEVDQQQKLNEMALQHEKAQADMRFEFAKRKEEFEFDLMRRKAEFDFELDKKRREYLLELDRKTALQTIDIIDKAVEKLLPQFVHTIATLSESKKNKKRRR